MGVCFRVAFLQTSLSLTTFLQLRLGLAALSTWSVARLLSAGRLSAPPLPPLRIVSPSSQVALRGWCSDAGAGGVYSGALSRQPPALLVAATWHSGPLGAYWLITS